MGFKFGYIDKVCAIIRRHDSTFFKGNSENEAITQIEQMQKYLRTYSDLKKDERHVINRKISDYCFNAGYFNFKNNELKKARRWFGMGMNYNISIDVFVYWLSSLLPPYFIDLIRSTKRKYRK